MLTNENRILERIRFYVDLINRTNKYIENDLNEYMNVRNTLFNFIDTVTKLEYEYNKTSDNKVDVQFSDGIMTVNEIIAF